MSDILVADDDVPDKFCPMDDPHEDHYWMKGSYYCPGIKEALASALIKSLKRR